MKKKYITPRVLVQSVDLTTIIASSLYLNRNIVSNVDELAVKGNAWGDIWDDENDIDY